MKKYGYKGIIRHQDFINELQLSSILGLKEIGSYYDQESDYSDWFHFILNNQDILVPVRPLKYGVSWETLYQLGIVYSDTDGPGDYPSPIDKPRNQNVYIVINGETYKVTLLKGLNKDNSIENKLIDVYKDIPNGIGLLIDNSEWNQLMYRVSNGGDSIEGQMSNPLIGVWDRISNKELGTGIQTSYGIMNWCQEVTFKPFDSRILRGGRNVSSISYYPPFNSSFYISGWRPALRKIEPGYESAIFDFSNTK